MQHGDAASAGPPEPPAAEDELTAQGNAAGANAMAADHEPPTEELGGLPTQMTLSSASTEDALCTASSSLPGPYQCEEAIQAHPTQAESGMTDTAPATCPAQPHDDELNDQQSDEVPGLRAEPEGGLHALDRRRVANGDYRSCLSVETANSTVHTSRWRCATGSRRWTSCACFQHQAQRRALLRR